MILRARMGESPLSVVAMVVLAAWMSQLVGVVMTMFMIPIPDMVPVAVEVIVGLRTVRLG